MSPINPSGSHPGLLRRVRKHHDLRAACIEAEPYPAPYPSIETHLQEGDPANSNRSCDGGGSKRRPEDKQKEEKEMVVNSKSKISEWELHSVMTLQVLLFGFLSGCGIKGCFGKTTWKVGLNGLWCFCGGRMKRLPRW